MEWKEVTRRRQTLVLAALTVATALGTAGCVSQPWQLPEPYGYGSGESSTGYYGSSGVYGYGSRYGSGYPYYSYRQGVPYYPGSGYYGYPPGYYCRDSDRNGRCDNRQARDDDDHHHGGNDDDDDGKGHDGAPPRLGERPFKEVRRQFRQVEASGSSATPGSASPAPTAVVTPAPAARGSGGSTQPGLRAHPRSAAPASAPPRAEPRRERADAAAPATPALRAPRLEDAGPKSPRYGEPATSRRPLR